VPKERVGTALDLAALPHGLRLHYLAVDGWMDGWWDRVGTDGKGWVGMDRWRE
jgi:hypothetical protein